MDSKRSFLKGLHSRDTPLDKHQHVAAQDSNGKVCALELRRSGPHRGHAAQEGNANAKGPQEAPVHCEEAIRNDVRALGPALCPRVPLAPQPAAIKHARSASELVVRCARAAHAAEGQRLEP